MNYAIFVVTLFPLILPWVFRLIWPHHISWKEMGITIAVSFMLSIAVYGMGLYNETADVEIVNGEVTGKERVHDSYLRSYSCNCRTNSKGQTTCSTCYETRYTVTWNCHTNLGNVRIEHLDRTSKRVYDTPDPQRYTVIQKGDPAAMEHSYTNYVKAAPDSLFHAHKSEKFNNLIPTYPNRVFDYYKVNRVFAMGVPIPAAELAAWNQDVSLMLRKLGPNKQANAVVLFVNTADQSYLHALEGKWIGGKKNDVIVIVGTTAYPKIDWVAVSSWTDNQLFKVQLRDEIMGLGNIDRAQMISAIDKHTIASYVRKNMKDFEYLKDQIEPPLWVLILSVILGILASCGLSFYYHRNDPFGDSRVRFGRY